MVCVCVLGGRGCDGVYVYRGVGVDVSVCMVSTISVLTVSVSSVCFSVCLPFCI